MSLFINIVHSGLLENDSYQKKREVIFANYISLILCGVIIYSFLVRKVFFGNIAYGINSDFLFFGLILFVCPILLNRLLLTTLSRLFACIIPVIFIWLLYISEMNKIDFVETSVYSSLRIHLLSVSFIPYLLFQKTNPYYLILGIMPTFISFVFFESIMNFTGESISQRGLAGDDYEVLQHRTFVAYILVSGGCYIFHSIISRNDLYIQKILSELENKSDEIKAQNEKLLLSQASLNEVNQHLECLVERKTEDIKRQNEELRKYAFSNAHHVRGRIARILGLIELSKLEPALGHAWFFEKVVHETEEIDKVLQGIATDLYSVDAQDIDDTDNEAHIT